MIIRTLIVLVGLLLAACGPEPKSEKEVCGSIGCDACLGFACDGADAGMR